MAEQEIPSPAPLKSHGDKLSGAAGVEIPHPDPGKPDEPQPSDEPLKMHGDKLQAPVDAALGDRPSG
jgi:hypothetical protein